MNNEIIPTLTIVIPCYNEEAILQKNLSKLCAHIKNLIAKKNIASNSFIVFVDDGSEDKTWKIIEQSSDNLIKGVKLSHHVGHQNALSAGLLWVKDRCDAAISLDADLQDDYKAIEKFITKYQEGAQIVYGVRKNRPFDSWFKRNSANFFYKLMRLMGIEIIPNHADFRLMSKDVLKAFSEFSEVNLFLRGIFPLIGFKHDMVYYNREERNGGKSKYSIKRMVSLALDGISSFSIKPLRLIAILGLLIFLASLFASIWVVIEKIFFNTVHGWASIVLPIYFIGGIQLLSLGVIGEYIGKIYLESKKRPRYIIEKVSNE